MACVEFGSDEYVPGWGQSISNPNALQTPEDINATSGMLSAPSF
jgi:hypothetical protein